MTKELDTRSAILSSAELKELLGRPPVLSGENVKVYDEILDRLMLSVAPEDFLEQILINQWAACNWEAMRCMRHKALTVERNSRRLAETQIKLAQARAQTKAAQDPKSPGSDRQSATEVGRMLDLEHNIQSAIKEVDDILDSPTAELYHARALQGAIGYYLQLDQALDAALTRRDEALKQLERYRRGLGERVQNAADAIIDAEFNDAMAETEGEAVPLVPSSEVGQ